MKNKDYRLIYFRKIDRHIFFVRRVTAQEYRIIDSETNEKKEISYYKLRKDFEMDESNRLKIKEITEVRVC